MNSAYKSAAATFFTGIVLTAAVTAVSIPVGCAQAAESRKALVISLLHAGQTYRLTVSVTDERHQEQSSILRFEQLAAANKKRRSRGWSLVVDFDRELYLYRTQNSAVYGGSLQAQRSWRKRVHQDSAHLTGFGLAADSMPPVAMKVATKLVPTFKESCVQAEVLSAHRRSQHCLVRSSVLARSGHRFQALALLPKDIGQRLPAAKFFALLEQGYIPQQWGALLVTSIVVREVPRAIMSAQRPATRPTGPAAKRYAEYFWSQLAKP